MNDLFSLAGKNILITGSAQGIGFLLATGTGKYGAQIIINDITAERAELAVEKLHPGRVFRPLPHLLMLLINMKLMPPLNISKRTSAPLMCW